MKSPFLRASLLVLLVAGLLMACSSSPRTPEASKSATAPVSEPIAAEERPAPPSPEASAPKKEAKTDESVDTGEAGAATTRSADVALAEKGFGFVEEPSRTPEKTRSESPAASAPSASGLQAGFADDNKQFNYFVNFLAEYSDVEHLPIPVQERIVLKVTDSAGKPVPNADVSVSADGALLAAGRTYADGTFLFFPSEHPASTSWYTASVTAQRESRSVAFERTGKRQIDVKTQAARPAYQAVPLDILFILDTTGSMGEEIQRLKTTIEIINLNLGALSSRPRVRFGMVLYRDQGDEYTTRIVPLTEDLAGFKRSLTGVSADGGGDDPEDLQSALHDAMREIRWNADGIRLAFVITDAAPHLDYGADYTYVDAAHDARRSGIKIFSVGTGGLDISGELPLRQIAQYTYAKYIFLTYGEQGESGGGAPGSVSHHTGSNYQTDKLEAIIIRFAREELANLTDQPLTDEGDWFQASRTGGEEKAETLAKLFDMAISQIIDYASFRIPAGTSVAALPIVAQSEGLAADAEYFSEQAVLSLARNRTFSMVERKDLQAILKELELQMSGIADEANAARVGKILDAEMLLTSRMFDRKEGYEVFVKLLRVETGEILSVTKLVIDKGLGLSP
jgi:Mg-chelatase subunit ChlD